MSEQISVMFFCLGNICRSPLAEGVFRHKLQRRGLENRFRVASSGTSSYPIGEAPDPGSQAVARQKLGLDISDQRSQQLGSEDFQRFDYLVAMDHSNRRNALRLEAADEDKLYLLRDFEPRETDLDQGVPDPYGGGGDQFELVYEIVDRCLDEFLDFIERRHDL
jgi:protein-tyrosine phosphatase